MAFTCEPRTLHTEGVALQEDKDSVTLEGGRAAWATAFGSFLVQFCGLGYASSFGVYEDFYIQHYLTNETPSAISWMGSSSAFLICAVGLVSGSLYDRGYFYHLMITGSLLQSFSLFMLSLSKPDQYYQIFLSQGLGLGVAMGLMFIPSIAIISHHFQERRTLVMAFTISGSSLGAIVHPIMLNNFLDGPLGFANGVRASAGFVSALLLIACLCMRTRLDPPTTPVNYIAAARKCLRDVPFTLMVAGGFLFQTGLFYPAYFIQLDSIKHGINVAFSSYSLAILNASSLIGRATSGFIAPFTGVPNLAIIATMSCSVLIFGMIGLNSLASVVVLAVLHGYFEGLFVAITPPLMATLTPDLSELGARMGIAVFIGGFGSLIGPPISGALLTSNYIWWIPALFSGMVSLTGSIVFFIMRDAFVKEQIEDRPIDYGL
ncbi:MFS general substrate transporter [Suillus paluster]|uniref:MFS general substrate transporter n=1 Tax=Suillus paluster TaxID=48578 RepID=UPI001B862235|nr:MFS general substrate transporter [Suillus paluster]KAG1748489.1 MFS general substrate transporter [Suillus paluster]